MCAAYFVSVRNALQTPTIRQGRMLNKIIIILGDSLANSCKLINLNRCVSNPIGQNFNPGGLCPDRRAPGDNAEESTFQFRVCFSCEICLCAFVLRHVFFRVFLDTFSSGRVPPDAPGDAKVSLGSASGDQVCFFIDF